MVLFRPFLHSKTAIFGTPLVGGLKMILFQKFFLILFYITKLQYKPPGPRVKLTKSQIKAFKSPPYSEHRALCLRAPCSVSQSTVLWVSEHCALVLRLPCSVSQRLFIIHCMFVEGKSRTVFFLQTLLFTAFVATAQKIITYALEST